MSHRCPRRDDQTRGMLALLGKEQPPYLQEDGPDSFEVRDTGSPGILGEGRRCCSYCGSMDPDELMAAVEAGAVEVGPTDKAYKVYVEFADGGRHKFYLQHLSDAQCVRFEELHLGGKMRIGVPGYFYAGCLAMIRNKRKVAP